MIKVVFLAQFREKLGTGELMLEMGAEPVSVEQVKLALAERGERWRDLFECDRLLCAVNQDMASPETLVKNGDEVAFFPPVTGG